VIGTQPTGAIKGVVISAVFHEGLTVTVNGKPARLAVVDEAGVVIASGDVVAREAEAVAVNNYRNFLQGQGYLRVLSEPLPLAGSSS
jgi:C4-dicarboxylate-specific signal transduction histidine kinase